MLPKTFLRKCSTFSADQRGAVLVLVSLSLVVLMGFAAFCLDLGALYKVRREMVTAADAAALAGAKQLAISRGANVNDAIQKAVAYASNNGATEINAEVKNTGSGRQVIEVTAGKNVEYAFARVLGFKNKVVSARAVATWGYPQVVRGGNILPLFMDEGQFKLGDCNLHVDKIGYPGNWGLLDVGSGASDIKSAFQGNPLDLSKVFSIGGEAKSEPGNVQSIIDGIEVRMNRYKNNEVTMEGLIPIVKVIGKPQGKLDLEVLGFAVYRIKDVVVDKKGNGSKNADPVLVGGPTPVNYGASYEKGTIIGEIISDVMVDVNVVLKEGDQESPGGDDNPNLDPDLLAKYVKLID